MSLISAELLVMELEKTITKLGVDAIRNRVPYETYCEVCGRAQGLQEAINKIHTLMDEDDGET